jgi:hypothetical protein
VSLDQTLSAPFSIITLSQKPKHSAITVADLIRYLAQERLPSPLERKSALQNESFDEGNMPNLAWAWMLYEDPTMAQPCVCEMTKSNRGLGPQTINRHMVASKIKYRSNLGNIFEKARDVHIEGTNDELRYTVFAFLRLGKEAPATWRSTGPSVLTENMAECPWC